MIQVKGILMAKQKYYVVWVGQSPGIYTNWAECQAQVHQAVDAKFKSFDSMAEAEKAYQAGWKGIWGQGQKAKANKTKGQLTGTEGDIDYNSISVDVGTSGNPGPVEYQGVDTRTGEVIFSYGPVSKGTNNLGEFLAIVHALAYLKKVGSNKTVYSDSVNAINWVKKKAVSSTLERDESTAEIWTLVDRAVQWLHTNKYDNKVLKWETRAWGEIKADYGRK
jgi:ribonuclease HI